MTAVTAPGTFADLTVAENLPYFMYVVALKVKPLPSYLLYLNSVQEMLDNGI